MTLPTLERFERGGLSRYRLEVPETQACVEVVPERGALVTAFQVAGDRVLYLDEATLEDPTKNVRGGIPVLFPIAGKLPRDSYELEGRTWSMKQHGFARTLPWRVLSSGAKGPGVRLECGLESTSQTLAQFPFRFEARLAFTLEGTTLTLDWTVTNRDERSMPLQLGYHPYFEVSQAEKARASVESRGNRSFDNRVGEERTFSGFDLTQPEVDLHVLNHDRPGTVLHRPGRHGVELRWSPEFQVLVVWTLAEKDFVCVEPWTAPGGALARRGGLPLLEAGATASLKFSMRALPPEAR
jgi:galactose mutarotase-like enzyme